MLIEMPVSLSSHDAFAFADLIDLPGALNPTLMALALAGLLMLIRKPPDRKEVKIRLRRK
ncbi:MAG: hypothetical protein AAFY60_20295 [Myxococcota bacterium]